MKEENQSSAGICCPVLNSRDREEENDDSFEAIFEAMNNNIVLLPGDFVMAILLALPVKSLLRFKSVCWSWHDLILSRRFINIHHDGAKRSSSSLICFYNDKNVSRRTTYNSVSVSHEDGTVTPLSLPPPTLYERHKIYVADSCRGMVCFSSGLCPQSVVVWNIATRNFRTFHGIVTNREPHPRNHITMRSNRLVSDLATGFTFLPITNEYKLVRVILYFNNSVYIRITRWNDSMIFLPAKEMDIDFPYNITQFGRCLNANDAIHWLGHKIEGGPSIVIAFDMIEDKFREISTPFNIGDAESCKSYHRKLLLLNGNRLAIFGSLYSDTPGYYFSYTLWALNDYGGASESWAKQYTFETRHDLQPMGFCFNGEVVVIRMDGSPLKMGLYDCHTDQIKDLPVVINNELYYSSIFDYKESLVPLPRTINNVCSFKYCPFQTSIKRSIIDPDDDDDDDDEL